MDNQTFQVDAALTDAISQHLRAAYERGWNDARQAILSAASVTPSSVSSVAPASYATSGGGGRTGRRAPKGLLTEVLTKVLREHPRSTIQQLESILPSYDKIVSPKSVGNELRRGDGKVYRREGAFWFALGDNSTESPAAQISLEQFSPT